MKHTHIIGILCCAAAACATTRPPPELLEARQAYAMSQQSMAARYNPVALHDAKNALDNAEKLFKDESDSPKARDAAYVATRRAERATVEGEAIALQKQQQEIASSQERAKSESMQATEADLRSKREQLDQAQRDLELERQRAQDSLSQLEDDDTSVEEAGDETVITMTGAFLFASNKATPRPEASPALEKIAFVLKQQPNKQILIEGHTDSTGSAERNIELSKQRAEVVASYLSARGVPREKITTEGAGAEHPLASNDTPEGRAANRRVEITLRED